MFSDYSEGPEELHQFAQRIGLKREWFQDKRTPHYDLTPGKREKALKLGAEFMATRTRYWAQKLLS